MVVNKLRKVRVLEKQYKEIWLEDGEIDKDMVFQQFISDISDIPNAYEMGLPIHYYKPRQRCAREYNKLVAEILDRIGDEVEIEGE